MRGQRFRIKTPTLAVLIQDGRSVAVTVPAGSIVEVTDGPLDSNRLLDVIWDGKPVMMFTIDIRERGERIDGNGH